MHTKPIRTTPELSARQAGLHYCDPHAPGIKRVRFLKHVYYRDQHGKRVRDAATLKRIRSLVLPPAWTDVWICTDPKGHLQATGRDKRGRLQYRYHAQWRKTRDQTKYHKMVPFGEVLPRIRRRVRRDLRRPALDRQKVLALAVRLLEETLIRIGNDEYAEENDSFGLTTMRNSHAHISAATVRFCFRGKSGKDHDISIQDKILARVLRSCRDLPGEDLLEYIDDKGDIRDVRAEDVNAYLREIAGTEITAKDFRTWAGTVHAALLLAQFPPTASNKEITRNIVRAITDVSAKLGNTPAVCRKSYVHPFILDCYSNKSLQHKLHGVRHRRSGLKAGEAAVLRLLQECV